MGDRQRLRRKIGECPLTITTASQLAPRMTPRVVASRFVPPVTSTWEYYSARMYHGWRDPTAGERGLLVDRVSLRPPGPWRHERLTQPSPAPRIREWYTPAQNRNEWERIEREGEYELTNRVGASMFDVDSSDGQTTYIDVEETAPRHPANRRKSAWIDGGGFRSNSRAKERTEKQVPEIPRHKRGAPE